MKKILKRYFPLLFRLSKRIYNSLPFYKNKLLRLKKLEQINNKKRKQEELKIMKNIFNNEYIVHNGHFKGMKYIKRSSGSALLPKILGSYEEPIQDWIEEVINNEKYKYILDIGCAEGYYACGFAMKMPKVNITAYDIDENARKNTKELKELNKLDNIEIKSECTHVELNEKSNSNTLVFYDIEGFEEILLDPIRVPNLKYADMIIESHDCFIPGVTEELIKRFYLTHTIRIIVDYPYRIKKYCFKKEVTKDLYNFITDERRSKYMKFIYLEAIHGKL